MERQSVASRPRRLFHPWLDHREGQPATRLKARSVDVIRLDAQPLLRKADGGH
jgi:hypothetical protein